MEGSGYIYSYSSENRFGNLFYRLSRSKFRSRFCLDEKEILYVRQKGIECIRGHAFDFVEKRLAPAYPANDGKQTPMRGHPVFKAQHATATCCRGCLEKWHHIPAGKELSYGQQEYVVDVIMAWIEIQMRNAGQDGTFAEYMGGD